MRFRNAFTWVSEVLVVALVGIQFVRPGLTNPPVAADLNVPPEVKKIVQRSCYNCHSNETRLPWFDRVAPAYWIAVRDVKHGRARLNFSEIGKLPIAQQKAALFESVSQIELGAMPLPSYRWVHPESVINQEELGTLKSYLAPAGSLQPSTEAEISAADAQYAKWIQTSGATPSSFPGPKRHRFPAGLQKLEGHQQHGAV